MIQQEIKQSDRNLTETEGNGAVMTDAEVDRQEQADAEVDKTENLLDMRGIIASKSKKAAQRLPGWLIRLLTRITHIDDVNLLTRLYGSKGPLVVAQKTIEYAGVTYSLVGEQNIPQSRCTFVSNHPLGGLDGLILITALSPHCPNGIKLIVNDLLMYIKPLAPLFIPVNKHGAQSSEYLKAMDDGYNSDTQIVIFPAGLCSRLIDGQLTDLPWHRSFAVKSVRSGRTIVPVYFEGRNSRLFYTVAKIRKKLGIKFNLEMILLPHEMFRPVTKNIVIHVGKPLDIDPSTNPNKILEIARNAVYSMKP